MRNPNNDVWLPNMVIHKGANEQDGSMPEKNGKEDARYKTN